MTVDLFSIYLLSRVDIVIRYIEVNFTFGLPDYVCYVKEFVISRFYSIHFTVTLAGTSYIVRDIEGFVKSRFTVQELVSAEWTSVTHKVVKGRVTEKLRLSRPMCGDT